MIWNARNGSVPVGDTEMDYVSFGRGERKLVILPGLSDGLTTVRGKALMLAPGYHMFFDEYTVYMFSRKRNMPADYTIRGMADDQACAMRQMDIRGAYVMGVSQGGMIALYLAAEHPETAAKLVIAVSAARIPEMTADSVGQWIEYARKGDHRSLMIDTAEKSYSEKYLKRYRKMYPLIGHIGRPENYSRFMTEASSVLSFDATDVLDRISCPVLVIAGEDDRIVGVQASYELHEKIPGSALHVYPGLGHAAYEEAPDFNKRVRSFFGPDG